MIEREDKSSSQLQRPSRLKEQGYDIRTALKWYCLIGLGKELDAWFSLFLKTLPM
jgi:hypothetical protein